MTKQIQVRSTEEAMKLALEALESYKSFIDDAHIIEGQWHWIDGADQAITSLREALAEQPAQPQQKPVAVVSGYYGGQCVILPIDPARIFNSNTALYTSPPAQPQQDPVAVWELFEDGWDSIADPKWMETLPVGTKLYTSPPTLSLAQRQARSADTWVGLTDEEVFDVWLNEMPAPAKVFYQKLCRSVEAKLKEKNT